MARRARLNPRPFLSLDELLAAMKLADMRKRRGWLRLAVPLALGLLAMTEAMAGPECHNGAGYDQWLASFKQNAVASGVSRAAVSAALDGVTFDQGIIDRDRRQGIFSDSFLEFSDKVISKSRLTTGSAKLSAQAKLFADVERRFGVPGPVLVALWALESDFGSNMGNLPTLRSLATLAYDCRRTEMFTSELSAAVRIV